MRARDEIALGVQELVLMAKRRYVLSFRRQKKGTRVRQETGLTGMYWGMMMMFVVVVRLESRVDTLSSQMHIPPSRMPNTKTIHPPELKHLCLLSPAQVRPVV